MIIDQVVEDICNMPINFKLKGDKSMVDLFKVSGYANDPEAITVHLIEKYLSKYPNKIESWLLNSMDTRGTPAWYFSYEEKDTKWYVGYYPGGEEKKFDEPTKACAYYIKQYMEYLSDIVDKSG